MKTTPLVLLATLAAAGFALSQEKVSPDLTESTTTTARILDSIPDGTPPAPEAPKPEYKPAPSDILHTTTHQQDGRTITLQQIKPIALPPPPQAAEPAEPSPALLQRIAEYRAAHPRSAMMHLGATVYRSKERPARTLVQLWPQGGGSPVKFWSSADFSLIAGGIHRFIDSAGNTRQLFLMWSEVDTDRLSAALSSKGRTYTAPQIPTFPEGKATFQIIGEQPASSDLTALQSLHDLYNNHHAELLTAHQSREQARLQREAELKANPPQPKDITLRYWHTERPAAKGGDQ